MDGKISSTKQAQEAVLRPPFEGFEAALTTRAEHGEAQPAATWRLAYLKQHGNTPHFVAERVHTKVLRRALVAPYFSVRGEILHYIHSQYRRAGSRTHCGLHNRSTWAETRPGHTRMSSKTGRLEFGHQLPLLADHY